MIRSVGLVVVAALLVIVSCQSNSGEVGKRVVTVIVIANEWSSFVETALLPQAVAYSRWIRFENAKSLQLETRTDSVWQVISKKEIGKNSGIWEVRVQTDPLLTDPTARQVTVRFSLEESGSILPSLVAIQKALARENWVHGSVRVVVMNVLPDREIEALVEIKG